LLDVKKIEPEMTYMLRQSVLRPQQSLEDSKYPTDLDDGTFHIGAFYREALISVASFIIDTNPDFPDKRQYRLRQMATHGAFRKMGAGRAVVHYAEGIIREQKVDLLWCKARTNVQRYYHKLGFRPYGEVFDYPPIGLHIMMIKNLI